MRLGLRLLTASGVMLALTLLGQHPGCAQAQSQQDLSQQIQDLRQRLDQLEQQQQKMEQQQSQPAAAPPSPPSTPAVAPTAAQPQSTSAASSQPVERALERSLIEQGGLLLPSYKLDVVPELQYTYTDTTSELAIVSVSPTTIAPVVTRQDTLETGVIARYGLPLASQFNIHIPYITQWSKVANQATNTTQSSTTSGLGDIDFGLSKQLLFEHRWVPDAIATVDWKTTTGTAHFNPLINSIAAVNGTGNGFDQALASLTLVKRQDPLVFLATGAYTYVFSAEHGGANFEPGDEVEGRLGTILAASADTSLRFIFDTTFFEKGKLNGMSIAGSDTNQSFLEIGASSVISASTLVDAAVDIGLTRQTPDFRFILQVPIHF
jgi:outer membrane murein-binding lipoprotein Lpp